MSQNWGGLISADKGGLDFTDLSKSKFCDKKNGLLT